MAVGKLATEVMLELVKHAAVAIALKEKCQVTAKANRQAVLVRLSIAHGPLSSRGREKNYLAGYEVVCRSTMWACGKMGCDPITEASTQAA